MMFSIIVCSHRPERAAFIRQHYEALFASTPYELIIIPDAPSICEGYWRGLQRSRGRFLIFSHDDIEFVTPYVASRIAGHLGRFDLIGIAGTSKLLDARWTSAGDPFCFSLVIYPEGGDQFSIRYLGRGPLCVPGIQALDGCFLACRREVAEAVGFDADTFDGFHLYDMDFTFSAYAAGYALGVCRDLPLIHASLGNLDSNWEIYRRRFEAKFYDRLSHDPPGQCNVLGTIVPRAQLEQMCLPESIIRAVPVEWR
jgi:hypothetical protein